MNFFLLFLFAVSPTLPGTVPPNNLPGTLNSDFNPMQTTPVSQTLLQPPHGGVLPPTPGYLPPFHFAHPDMLHKNPFLPYDLANLRAVTNGRSIHNQHNNSGSSIPSSENLSSSRLSPASSRPSSSSPPSSAHSISIKMNSSIEIGSNHEQSEDDSDDEQIDVVKSAFVPILRPTISNPIVNIPDSTVQDKPIEPARQRCELKAPSSRKPVHQSAVAVVGPRSPETKLKSPGNTHKSVWRPY